MMSFDDIQVRARDLLASRFEPEGIRPLGDIYWRSLLGVAVALIVCAIAYGLLDLFGVLNTLASAADTSPLPPAALDRSVLKNVVQGFSDREATFTKFQTTAPAAIPDPSN